MKKQKGSLLSSADRRGDHSDHRGYRYSEPPPVAYGANEASAVGSLRTINTAEVTYSTTYRRRVCFSHRPRRRGCDLRDGHWCNLTGAC